jgi:hypothetical protein
MEVYKHHGDAILVSAPLADDVMLHVFHTEYERRELLRVGGHNHNVFENKLEQGVVLFHGPAAREAQMAVIRALVKNKAPVQAVHEAAEKLGHMIIESETVHHA